MNNTSRIDIGIIYHANCLDGFTSAWVVEKHFEERDKSIAKIPYSYDDPIVPALALAGRCEHLYVVDFSFKPEVLQQLATATGRLTMLDHHRTAFIDHTGKTPEELPQEMCMLHEDDTIIVLDNQKSGALLAWCWLHSAPASEAPLLVKHVSDYDLWQFKLSATQEIRNYLTTLRQTTEEWNRVAEQLEDEREYVQIMRAGAAIRDYEQAMVDILVAAAAPVYLGDELGMYVAAPYTLASAVAGDLALACGSFGMTAIYSDEKLVVSLRSRSGYDVSALAKRYGGGGHAQAAGFTVEIDLLRWSPMNKFWFITPPASQS